MDASQNCCIDTEFQIKKGFCNLIETIHTLNFKLNNITAKTSENKLKIEKLTRKFVIVTHFYVLLIFFQYFAQCASANINAKNVKK